VSPFYRQVLMIKAKRETLETAIDTE